MIVFVIYLITVLVFYTYLLALLVRINVDNDFAYRLVCHITDIDSNTDDGDRYVYVFFLLGLVPILNLLVVFEFNRLIFSKS